MVRKIVYGVALLALATATPVCAEVVKADTPFDLGVAGGFIAVRDWDKVATPGLVRLTAPEGDLTVTLVDVGDATDAKAAAAVALARAGVMPRPLETATAEAPISGWDEHLWLRYTVPPAEHGSLQIDAVRKGKGWVALIVNGSDATGEKRSAAIGTMYESLRAKGYQEENFAGKPAQELTPERIAALKDFVTDAMRQLQVPGVGLALIQHGKVVWEGGLGVKRLGGDAPVGAHTRFMIASNTKGMSTLLLSMLVDQGKLGWDQPVTQVYPGFRLGSDATTRAVVLRQLVCACTGLPRKDLEWLFNGAGKPARDTFAQLALTEPTSKYGEVFQYNNLMAAAAGYIGGHIAYPDLELGAAYDKAMQTRIFDPLGMTDTTFDMAAALAGDHADPTGLDIDRHPIVPTQTVNYQIQPYRPAGGAWSSAHDVARYVLLELGEGQMPDGTRLVSAANLLERRRRNVPVSQDSWYGMGLETRHRYGIDVVYHGGSLAGYKTNWFALPQAGVGAVVLTNSDEGVQLLDPFLRRLIEMLWDAKPEAATRISAAAAAQQAVYVAIRAKLTFGEAAIDKLGLATRYRNADLGQLVITRADGHSRIAPGPYNDAFAVQHNADGTDSLVMTGPDLVSLDYLVGKAAGKRTLTLRDGQHVYVYTEE
ncbi:serine hydrolase domain-containing protein [Novosphingobium sp.]|uniref:serine hydrolase domain-containing protein n=1 Tax=Novosphingobium sp. TaxID=1874826 RepID=UPI00333E90C9